MAGTLYLVATPIGNLKDITLRALEVLKSVDFIACEDTRHSRTLLSAYEINKPLISYYKNKEKVGGEAIIELLKSEKDVALITDAGMPSISDPGAIVVARAREEGVKVSVIPGASAVVSAVAISGVQSTGFIFLGFLPEKTNDKIAYVQNYVKSEIPVIFYCSPHNIIEDVSFLYSQFGDRKVYVVKEITKIYESVEIKSLKNFDIGEPKGEYVLIVEGGTFDNPLCKLTVAEQIKHYIDCGLTKKDAIKQTAADRGLTKNEVYQEALSIKD